MYTAARGCNQAAQKVGTDLQAGKCKIRRVIRYFPALHSFLLFCVHASLTALLPLLEHIQAWLHTATSFYGRGNRGLS